MRVERKPRFRALKRQPEISGCFLLGCLRGKSCFFVHKQDHVVKKKEGLKKARYFDFAGMRSGGETRKILSKRGLFFYGP
jgi:hypothetical protein